MGKPGNKMKVKVEKDKISIIEFIEETKNGKFTHKNANIPKEYIIRYDLTDNIDELNESTEEYHFGISN